MMLKRYSRLLPVVMLMWIGAGGCSSTPPVNPEIRPDLAAQVSSVAPQADAVIQANYTTEPEETPAPILPVEASNPIPGEPYTMDTFIQLALENNPTLVQAQEQISASFGKALQAGLYPNPRFVYIGDRIGAEGTAGEFQGGELQQRIVTANKLGLSRQKYVERAKVAEHLAVMQEYKVINDVRVHYTMLLAAQTRLDLQHELLKNAEDRLLTTKEEFNEGQANEVAVRRTKADLERQRLDVQTAETMVAQRFRELTALVGADLPIQPVAGTLDDAVPTIDFEQAYERIVNESPEVLAALAKLRADSVTIQRERVEYIPDIIIGGGPGYSFTARDTVANASVRIEMPIFDRNQGTIQQAEADYRRQQGEVTRTQRDLRSRLAMEFQQYQSATNRVEGYRNTILPELKAAYETVLKSYKADRVEWPQVLDVYNEYTMRRLEYIDQMMHQRSSAILINGYLLHGGLDAAPNPTPPGHIDAIPKPR